MSLHVSLLLLWYMHDSFQDFDWSVGRPRSCCSKSAVTHPVPASWINRPKRSSALLPSRYFRSRCGRGGATGEWLHPSPLHHVFLHCYNMHVCVYVAS
jgi:hypothetical protein